MAERRVDSAPPETTEPDRTSLLGRAGQCFVVAGAFGWLFGIVLFGAAATANHFGGHDLAMVLDHRWPRVLFF